MSSYQESGKRINERIADALSRVPEEDRKTIIDGMLWFGQVAKYRCRHNTAYDTFAAIALRNVAVLHRAPPKEEASFDVLQVASLYEEE